MNGGIHLYRQTVATFLDQTSSDPPEFNPFLLKLLYFVLTHNVFLFDSLIPPGTVCGHVHTLCTIFHHSVPGGMGTQPFFVWSDGYVSVPHVIVAQIHWWCAHNLGRTLTVAQTVFFSALNTNDYNLTFTHSYSIMEIPFLDVQDLFGPPGWG